MLIVKGVLPVIENFLDKIFCTVSGNGTVTGSMRFLRVAHLQVN